MAVIEKFLGKQVEIPEDRRYDVKQGLWAKSDDDAIVFGFSQPALVLSGGIKDIDWLVNENQPVRKSEAILFAITGKIMYIESPVAGGIIFNKIIKENISLIANDPYGEGWLFRIQPDGGLDRTYETLSVSKEYIDKLNLSEGLKNPEGLKGGVSGICKAVYTGIGEQKI